MSDRYILVGFDTTYSQADIRNYISAIGFLDQGYQYKLYSTKITALKLIKPMTCIEISDILYTLQKNPIVEYAHFTMKTNDCTNPFGDRIGKLCVRGYSNYFYVKVSPPTKLTDLYKMMAETNTEMASQGQFMPSWFELKATKHSKGNALQMANYFFESKLFEYAEPDPFANIPVE